MTRVQVLVSNSLLAAVLLCGFNLPALGETDTEMIVGVEKVLGAAAWTYIAAAVSAIGVWLFYVFSLLFRGREAAAHR